MLYEICPNRLDVALVRRPNMVFPQATPRNAISTQIKGTNESIVGKNPTAMVNNIKTKTEDNLLTAIRFTRELSTKKAAAIPPLNQITRKIAL